jgi:GNAT superfamily N-acetyltransferase
MTPNLKLLGPGDEAELERFLAQHRDSSMFLRANSRQAGLLDRGEPLQGTYVGAFRGGSLVGVAAHAWNGMVLVQAPEFLDELVRVCTERSGRAVSGFTGASEQVARAHVALGIDCTHARLLADEGLYALDLSHLSEPVGFAFPEYECRAPLPGERDTLVAWRVAYDVETLGGDDSPDTRTRAAGFLDWQIAEGNAWVALERGALVSLTAFNAALPDIVQVGGVYTPPELRGRGFAKFAVGTSLRFARERGADRSVLFTQNPSAIRTYEALGFRRVGDYSLILL